MTSPPCGNHFEKHMFFGCLVEFGEIFFDRKMCAEFTVIRINLALSEEVIAGKVDWMIFDYQKSLNATLICLRLHGDFSSSSFFSSMNVSKWNHKFEALTWMSFADRFWREQERCVVFHLVAVVGMVSIGVTIRCGFGHFKNFFS